MGLAGGNFVFLLILRPGSFPHTDRQMFDLNITLNDRACRGRCCRGVAVVILIIDGLVELVELNLIPAPRLTL